MLNFFHPGSQPAIGVDFEGVNSSVFKGMSFFGPMMICFYVGFCYNRYYQLYFICMKCQGHIFGICQLAKSYLAKEEDIQTVWRYLNLIHVAGFTGLGKTYNKHNLFNDFVHMYDLVPDPGERRVLDAIDVDKGGRVYRLVITWLITHLHDMQTGELLYAQMFFLFPINSKILQLRNELKTLYDYHFQPLPYVYTHLIGLSSFLFLLTNSITQGFHFIPDAPISYGFAFPAFGLFVTTFTSVGLVEIGSTLCDPFGGDSEDFPIFTFLNFTAVTSRHIIDSKDATEYAAYRAGKEEPDSSGVPGSKTVVQRRRSLTDVHDTAAGVCVCVLNVGGW